MDSFGTACNVTGDGALAVIIDRLQRNQIVATQTRILYENLLHLHREHIDTLDNEHVVSTALDTINTTMGTTAFARFGDNPSQVTRAIP